MMDTAKRLRESAAYLDRLDQRRREMAISTIGVEREFEIVMRELCELEADILQDPGALGALLVRARRRGKSFRQEAQQ